MKIPEEVAELKRLVIESDTIDEARLKAVSPKGRFGRNAIAGLAASIRSLFARIEKLGGKPVPYKIEIPSDSQFTQFPPDVMRGLNVLIDLVKKYNEQHEPLPVPMLNGIISDLQVIDLGADIRDLALNNVFMDWIATGQVEVETESETEPETNDESIDLAILRSMPDEP